MRDEVASRSGLPETRAALNRAQASARALFEHAPTGLLVLTADPAGVVIDDANDAFCRTTGLDRAAITGRTLAMALGAAIATVIIADAQRCNTRDGVDAEHVFAFPSGERFVRCCYRTLPSEEPGMRRILLTQIDQTDSRRVELALRQALRLEVVGQLTGGVAHDFNNLLTAVLGSLELLSRKVTDGRQRHWIDVATEAAQRGATLTQQLLSYARKQFLAPRALDVPEVIGGMAELIRGSLGGRIVLQTDFDPATWLAEADTAQLEMALLNLVVNARTAMPAGGTLVLSTRNVAPGDPALPPELASGAYVALAVCDTGYGMAPDILARAMEPFFTTKGIGQGSGLGLSQAYGFARQLGGTVRLRSEVGAGTTAEIFLPRAVPASESA